VASQIAALLFGNLLPALVGGSLFSAFAPEGCGCLILSLHEEKCTALALENQDLDFS
jgi:hypothetical protein